MPNLDRLLTVQQAATELSLSPRTVRHRISAGTIKATKVGEGQTSAYVITRREVERVKRVDAGSAA